MRTIEQAEKDCRAAWAAQPEATQGWCIHHRQEWEALSEPIVNRIAYILSEKPKREQVTRLDNMRPMSAASAVIVAPARKAYDEAKAAAWKAYTKAKATAWKAYREAFATAWKAYNEAKAAAWKAYNEAFATAEKAYTKAMAAAVNAHDEAIAPAWKAFDEAKAAAHRADVPTHTWNGKSIFKSI